MDFHKFCVHLLIFGGEEPNSEVKRGRFLVDFPVSQVSQVSRDFGFQSRILRDSNLRDFHYVYLVDVWYIRCSPCCGLKLHISLTSLWNHAIPCALRCLSFVKARCAYCLYVDKSQRVTVDGIGKSHFFFCHSTWVVVPFMQGLIFFQHQPVAGYQLQRGAVENSPTFSHDWK